MRRIYLDNAATSWPKPNAVAEAVVQQITVAGAPAGRGTYQTAIDSDQVVAQCRCVIADLIGASADEIAIAANGTHALNIAVQGYLRPGDHVVTTQIEHNSTRRPLAFLEATRDVEITTVPSDAFGFVGLDEIQSAIRTNTRLVVISHASNVTGAIQDISAIGEIVRGSRAALLVDAAQSLGHLHIDVQRMSIDMLASSGHKGCLGPLGTGILYLSDRVAADVQPLIYGGSGRQSVEATMPTKMPYRHEAGNLNVPAIAGLLASLQWLRHETSADPSERLATEFATGLREIDHVRVLRDPNRAHVGIVSVAIEGWEPSDVTNILDSQFGIEARAGLHCAPQIHESLGTLAGTVRFSFGRFNIRDDVDRATGAIRQLTAT